MRPPSAPPLHVAATGPRFQAIARAITDEIRRGVLVPGAQLPSSRALARALDVHRNTVLAALGELEAQGWITTQPARGTFVSDALPASTARAALAALVRTLRAVPATADHVLVTRGSQMALDLCARALLRPGDRVAVEALGYRPAWHALTLAGATLVPIPVDGDGLDVAALARAHARAPLRALYTTPHHQYPTTVTMSAARRLALMALARRHRWAIFEDDYDHEFHYDGRPVTPLAADDPDGHVVYVGTLSKVLAPGLRLGFVVAPPPVIATLATWRAAMDRQGDQPMEAAVAELIDDGELERHMRRMRVLYQARRDALVAGLAARLPGVLTAPCPRGGISLWAAVAPGLDVAAWAAAAAAQRVLIAPGARYTFDGHEPGALRLVFAPSTPAELARAVAVLAATAPRPTSRSPSATGSRRRAGPSGSSPPRR